MDQASPPVRRALFILLADGAGGAERVAATLATRLHRTRGWKVSILVAARRPETSFLDGALPADLPRAYGPLASPHLSLPFLALRLIGRHDAVFATHVTVNALVSMLRRLGLLRARRLVTRETTTLFDRYGGLRKLYYRLLYWMYGGQDVVIAQTAYMAEHIAPALPAPVRDRIRVLDNPIDLAGIDERAARPPSPEIAALLASRPGVVFCGRLIEVKRPLMALDAFVALRERSGEDLQFVVMGEGALADDLTAAAKARGLEDRVHLLGLQANPYAVMSRCAYGLLTSEREGFPNVVIEMMACRVRKVAMTPCTGGLERLTGVAVADSAEGLAAALAAAHAAGEDCAETYRSVVAQQSPEQYLAAAFALDSEA